MAAPVVDAPRIGAKELHVGSNVRGLHEFARGMAGQDDLLNHALAGNAAGAGLLIDLALHNGSVDEPGAKRVAGNARRAPSRAQ